MRKRALLLMGVLTVLSSVTGCSSMIKTVDNSAYDVVDSYDYSSMRDQDKYFDPLEEKRNIDRGVYKGDIKDEALAYAPEYPTEPETTAEDPEFVPSVWPTGKPYTGPYNNNSQVNQNVSQTQAAVKETTAAAKPTEAQTKNNNTSSITVNDSTSSSGSSSSGSSSSSSSSSSSNKNDDDDTPEKRRNPASVIINGSKYDTYITIEGYYRGNKAVSKLNKYNARNAIEYNMDFPDGYEPVIVQFTVTASENAPNKTKTLIPEVRVRDESGSSFDEVPTYVSIMRFGDYSDDNSETKSYEAVFEMPEDEDGFQLIFGASNGNTFRFKSSSLDESYEEED